MNEDLQGLLDRIDQAWCRVDTDLKIIEMSGAFERRYGAIRRLDEIIHREDRRDVAQAIADANVGVVRHRLLEGPGGLIDWAVSVTSDKERLLLSVTSGEAERRLAEQKRANDQLEQFVYVVSHDLNEPLRMVTSFTQLLKEDCAGRLGDDAETYIDFATEGANRLRALLRDLVIYSRVSTRGKPFANFDAARAVELAKVALDEEIEASGATIVADDLHEVFGDRDQIALVFEHLFANAIQFRGAKPPHVVVSSEEVEGAVRITVTDNGIGLEEQQFERMFGLFKRLKPREGTGTGIGLALCRRIVERHQGRINAEIPDSPGLRIVFTLPSKAS